MRIEAIDIRNFRGLRRAHVSGLAESPLVTLSGPNGSGKSLLFEALGVLARVGRPNMPLIPHTLMGPWGSVCELRATVALTQAEREALRGWADERGMHPGMGLPDQHVTFGLRLEAGAATSESDAWGALLKQPDFATRNPFSEIDYLPADRTFPRGEQPSVNPSLLRPEQTEQFRQQVANSFVQQRQMVSLSGIAPVLASLDYLDLLADRSGTADGGDFEAITTAFHEATGKRIQRPSIDTTSAYGASLLVETPTGMSHTIDQLSSGEQEVLGLMYFARRLSARGGVLLIDEPELHLHPALQRSLFAILESVAERAQVWIATHSPRLVTSASLRAILHMVPPSAEDRNQLSRASDEAERLRLLEELGVHPVEALQSDVLVIVEGATDKQRLSALLPLELGRATILEAGNASGVESACRTLDAGDSPLPYIGVRDRDLLDEEEVAALQATVPHLYVWPSRNLESMLLQPRLLRETLERAGRPVTEETILGDLREVADGQKQEVCAGLLEKELARRHRYNAEGQTPVERLKSRLSELRRVASDKLDEIEDVEREVSESLDRRWGADFLTLADGKRLVGEYRARTPFRTNADFLNALLQTAREAEESRPAAITELQRQLLLLPRSTD